MGAYGACWRNSRKVSVARTEWARRTEIGEREMVLCSTDGIEKSERSWRPGSDKTYRPLRKDYGFYSTLKKMIGLKF